MIKSVFHETGAKMITATWRIFYMQNLKLSQLDVVTSVFNETGAKMISTTRHIFYMLQEKKLKLSFDTHWDDCC